MKKAIFAILFVVAGFVAGYGYGRWYGPTPGETAGGKKVLYYYDPMHPSYRSDKPGIAPDCGMDLVPAYADGHGAGQKKSQGKILYYYDPEQPEYHASVPGLNPETGNTLVAKHEEAAPGSIQVSAENRQLIGVRTGVAEVAAGHAMIRAAARIVADETRVSSVTSRTEGWIEKVFVDYTGRMVKAGEPMLTLYSPELLASQQEYVLALGSRDTLAHSVVPGVIQSQNAMLGAARRRLEHWGLDQTAIERLAVTREPQRTITIFAPASGFVTERKAFPNQRVMGDAELYKLTDLSHVWIIADIYEADAPRIRLGQMARVTPSYLPNRALNAKVTYIYPQVDAETRTLKVRLESDNPDFVLRPDLFCDVEFHIASPPRLSVPAEAVLDTGLRQIVFIDAGNGVFAPREVKTGERFENRIEIVSGLRAGEAIVVSGAFLLDSESQMKNPVQPAGTGASSAPAGHKHD